MTDTETKQALREAARARRREAHARLGERAGAALLEHFRRLVTVPPGATVSGYWPAGSEIDVRPLLAWLHGRGHPLCLPVVVERGAPLVFRAWAPGDALVKGNGASVPTEDKARRVPDLLLVPLVAFDRQGARLGQGAGYYDRTLLGLRADRAVTALGIAYAAQEVERIPVDGHDQPLDAVLTEAGLIEVA